MPEISIKKNSTRQSIYLRFITTSPVAPTTVDDTTAGLELWYRRAGGERVAITPVALGSLLSPHTPGGIEPVDDGYSRVDIPDAAIATGADNVQVGGSATGIVGIGVLIQLTTQDSIGSSSPSSGGTSLVDCSVLLPEAPMSTHEGCPITTKRRFVPVSKGVCGTVVWTMRLPNGLAANFSDCIESGSISESDDIPDIKVRFQGCDRDLLLAEVDGEIVDASTGLIQFEIPEIVCQNSGIYQFQAGLMRDDSPMFVDSGLISVEHGLWGNTSNMQGPPTIQEIRFAMRDRTEENDLLRAVEFDDTDILEAIRWPVFQFNETPPDLGTRFNCNSFPFRYHWIQAIVGRLLTAAAHHYVRNKMLASSGGLNVDDKNKDTDYLRFANIYMTEWKTFIDQKKVELNARMGYGVFDSSYSYYTGGSW